MTDSVDPLWRSFILSKYAQSLSEYSPEHAAQYQKIEKQCDDFTTSLLDLCKNTHETKILLEYNPTNEEKNWHMALYDEHKQVVAHPFYQDFQLDKMTDGFNWNGYNFFWKSITVMYAFLLFLCSPFLVIHDSFLRDSSILFISPEKSKSRQYACLEGGQSVDMNNIKKEEEGGGNKENVEFNPIKCLHQPLYRMFV